MGQSRQNHSETQVDRVESEELSRGNLMVERQQVVKAASLSKIPLNEKEHEVR